MFDEEDPDDDGLNAMRGFANAFMIVIIVCLIIGIWRLT